VRRKDGLIAAAVAIAVSAVLACGPAEPPPAPAPLAPELARTYQAVCATCHARPGIGAPLTGVDGDWSERREKGLDALLVSTVQGVGGMPPLGTCGLCSVADFRALIRVMAGVP
jgi:cytochrome c5